jgi:hypothetical protein
MIRDTGGSGLMGERGRLMAEVRIATFNLENFDDGTAEGRARR